MKTAKDRFHEVMDNLSLNDYKVYTSIEGITKNMMSKLRQGHTEEVSVKILMPFCEAFPQVNANYILTGKLPMFIKDKEIGVGTMEGVELENGELESKNKNEENLSDLTKRFLNEVERMGVTFYNIAKNTGVKEAMFTKIKRGTQEPSKKFLSKFAECFPDANMEYIYLGKEDRETDRYKDGKSHSNKTTERWLEVISELKAKNLVDNDVALSKSVNGLTKQKMYNIRVGDNGVKLEILEAFFESYPQVNANYILTGKGSMFLEEENDTEKGIEYEEKNIITYSELMRQHDATIANYETMINQMKKKFSEIENSVEEMKELFKKVGA